MARKSSSIKVKEIDEQIKVLMAKKAEYEDRAKKEIGDHLIGSWGVEDIEEAKLLIDTLKDQAIELLNKKNNPSDKEENDLNSVGTSPGLNPDDKITAN